MSDNGDTIVLSPSNKYNLGESSTLGEYPNQWWDVLASVSVLIVVAKKAKTRHVYLRDKVLTLKGDLGLEFEDIIAEFEGSLGIPISEYVVYIFAQLSRENYREAISKYLKTDSTALEVEDYLQLLKKIRKSKGK